MSFSGSSNNNGNGPSIRWPLLRMVVAVLVVVVVGSVGVGASSNDATTTSTKSAAADGACKLLSIVPYSDQAVFTMRTTVRINNTDSYGNLSRWTPQTIGLTGYTYTAAILMAMDHFNSRDASIVPELAHLPSECDNVHFSNDSIVADGALNNIISGQIVLNATQDPNLCAVLGPYGIIPASWTTPITNSLNVPQIFYSLALTDVTEQDLYPTSVRTSLIPYDHASKLLSWLQHHGRTHLGIIHGDSDYDREYASVLSQYGDIYGVNTTIFSLTSPPPGKPQKTHAIQVYLDVQASGIRTLMRIYDGVGPRELLKLAAAADHHNLWPSNGYLWILDEYTAPVDDVPTIVQTSREAPPGSLIDKLLSGAIVVAPSESWEGSNNEGSSRFAQSWKSMNSSFVERVNAMVPLKPDQIEYLQAPPNFFQTTMPRRGAELVYDSVMAIGIGACRAAVTTTAAAVGGANTNRTTTTHDDNITSNSNNGTMVDGDGNSTSDTPGYYAVNDTVVDYAPPDLVEETTNTTTTTTNASSTGNDTTGGPTRHHVRRFLQDSPPPPQQGPPPQGGGGGEGRGPPQGEGQLPPPPPPKRTLAHDNVHVQGIMQSVFTGASGRVAFGKLGPRFKDRVPDDVSYGAYQIRPTMPSPDGSTQQYQVVLVERSTPTGAWEPVNGESFPFLAGGSPADPFGPPRVAIIPNYLPQWARAIGLTLMTVAWLISLTLTLVLWKWQNKPHIRAGQPAYLCVLCLGSIVTSSAILPLSFDENTGSTAAQLDAACTVTPWLFFIGINSMFAGLFCKLWRIGKVTQFRRQQVKAIQTVGPLILLLTSTVVCLIAWTVEDPWTWKRIDVNESPYETFGQCSSDHFAIYFSLLSMIMIVATGLAFVMAWKTKDLNIDSRFSDSNAVFLSIASQLQAWFLGLPVLAVLGDSSAEATYLGRVLLIWLFAMASVLIVIVPKIWRTCRESSNPSSRSLTSRVFVSGLSSDYMWSSTNLNAANITTAETSPSKSSGGNGDGTSRTADPSASELFTVSPAS